LFVAEAYDQSGANACPSSTPCHILNGTAANQPQLLPICINSLPCMDSANYNPVLATSGNYINASGTATFAIVVRNTGTSPQNIVSNYALGSLNTQSGGTVKLLGNGSGSFTATAALNTTHFITGVLNGASSVINVDGTETTGTATGTTVNAGGIVAFASSNWPTDMYQTEAGIWDGTTFTSTQRTNLYTNMSTYW
jgi:hypothetical protein